MKHNHIVNSVVSSFVSGKDFIYYKYPYCGFLSSSEVPIS